MNDKLDLLYRRVATECSSPESDKRILDEARRRANFTRIVRRCRDIGFSALAAVVLLFAGFEGRRIESSREEARQAHYIAVTRSFLLDMKMESTTSEDALVAKPSRGDAQ